MKRPFGLALYLLLAAGAAAPGRDWVHWRGPEQNGVSRETGLPDSFDPAKKQNVAWQAPFGGRSAPLVLDGKLFLIQGTGEGVNEGERIVCLDEKTGRLQWTHRVNVFHSDIVSSRLGWTTLTADPATKYVYAHTTGGYLLCLDAAGKLIWSHNLTEEYGRVTGYGGRLASPVFDSGLVIVGFPNSSWGDQGPGRCRFVAFDGKTGQVAWWYDTNNTNRGTYASTPVIAVINGQRLLISGASDGYIHAVKVRTGEKVWSHRISNGIINAAPVVDGNLVYCSHGEVNPEPGPIGRVVCVDAGQIDPEKKTPKLVWEHKGKRFGLASGAVYNGRYYAPEDSGTLFCYDGKTGKQLWEYRYASEVRGAPLIADGRIYIFDVKGRFLILPLNKNENQAPDADEAFEYKFKDPRGGLVETNGTPVAVNGCVYILTRTDAYCLSDIKGKHDCGKYTELPAEAKFDPNAMVSARIFPADLTAKPGEKVNLKLVFMDANGREVQNLKSPAGEWLLPTPPKTPTGFQPPPLDGKLDGGFGTTTLDLSAKPAQQSYVDFKSDALKWNLRARVRVVPQIPTVLDFEKGQPGGVPPGWINAQGKFEVRELPDKTKALFKENKVAAPPLAKANGYITLPDATDYTIQADLMGTEVRDKLADIGIVNCGYTLILDGKLDPATNKRAVRLTSWEARAGGRVNTATEFHWKPDTWYTAKLIVEQKEKTALIRAKVWERGTPEPEKWTLEFEDPNPNRTGAAAVYGYISNVGDGGQPGSEAWYDNIKITPNGKK